MSDSTTLQVSLAPIGYTSLAILLSLVCRALFTLQWNSVEDSTAELWFLVFWVMSVLPILYLSLRRWVENSMSSFMPQAFLFIVLSFGIQLASNAVSLSLGLLGISGEILIPLVWALPWLALTTIFKTSYSTAPQCKKLLIILGPTAFLFYFIYLIFPPLLLTQDTGNYSFTVRAAMLLSMFIFFYGIVFWRLRKAATHV